MTIPRLELGISRVSGERVSHCTIQSSCLSLDDPLCVMLLPLLLLWRIGYWKGCELRKCMSVI